MSLKVKRTTLADKISSLVTAAPTSFNSDDEYDDTKAKLVEQDFENEDDSDPDIKFSKFRTQNLDLLDENDKRYEGKKISRKTIEQDSLASESDEDIESNLSNDEIEDAEDSEGEEKEKKEEEEDSGDDEEDENETDSDGEPELEIDETNPLRRGNKITESNFRNISATDSGAEIEKGKCVRNQLGVWENLLEMRIKLQKCLIASNKMPQFDFHKEFIKADKNFSKSTNESKNNVSKLLDNLIELQNIFFKNYPETKQLSKDNKLQNKINEENLDDPEDEEIPSDTEDEMDEKKDEPELEEEEEEEEMTPRKKRKLKDYESLISKNHSLYSNYRNSVIQKWNDKTRVAVGNANNKGSTQPVVKQIEYILSDKSKLRKRTQLKRSEYEIIGKQKNVAEEEDNDGRRTQEYDCEIYDDDDFYHQLLRELIEFKSADVTDPIQLSKQWIQLQNMRSKMKRKIDTKATKGRRIRFGVHSKLVNFMAPILNDDLWSDEAKTELYNSLFGKIKEVEQK